ncbi:hypothetical protein [Ornithinibacillus halotolerans]|uniref:Uncharacterized protein n=1 Tax=Ornithinibacillus halotolerans TaxID=1274357 RepID=A0A916S6N1_9BACI|nr:hypothetical protein [Ornithinibacillus halotolerans]GGA86792.1 hypothetical protein GCM10008025_32080 [Ornithinibacillus halotolerans]
MKTRFIQLLLRILFLPALNITNSKDEEKLFNDLYESSLKKEDKLIEYNLTVPKYKFLSYLIHNKSVLLHGSNNKAIEEFEPRKQTLADGNIVTAIFASKDPIWPIFYATLDKGKIVGNIRNGVVSSNGKNKYHFYSLTEPTISNNPWTTGFIYILPEETFSYKGKGVIQFDEWISQKPVAPILKLKVNPDDFPFRDKVATHHSNESIIKSWLLYKFRL